MGSESNEKSKLEQSFESGADAFGQALADLTYEEYTFLDKFRARRSYKNCISLIQT